MYREQFIYCLTNGYAADSAAVVVALYIQQQLLLLIYFDNHHMCMCNVIYCECIVSFFPPNHSYTRAFFARSISFVCTFLRIPVTMRDESNSIYSDTLCGFVTKNNRNNTLLQIAKSHDTAHPRTYCLANIAIDVDVRNRE